MLTSPGGGTIKSVVLSLLALKTIYTKLMSNANAPRFSIEADKALDDLYVAYGSNQTDAQKINILENELGEIQVYATGGMIDDAIKLACLECEWLTAKGKIELELA